MIMDTLRLVENRGTIDMAHRLRQIVGQVFRYGTGLMLLSLEG